MTITPPHGYNFWNNIFKKHYFVTIIFLEILFVFFLYRPWLLPLDSIGSLDHDFFLAWQLLINDSLKKGQLLHWAHHFCGGIPGLANPQSGALSPYNLLGLYFGPVLQMKINLLIHFVICGCGFIFLCKRMKVSPYLGILGFLVWTGNGFVLFRILHGQQTFYPLLYLPLLFAFFWPYIDKVSVKNIQIRDIAGGSLLLIFMILEDGFQVLIYTYILLACISIYSIYKTKTLGSLVLISYWGIISVGLCLFRLLPVVELLSELPRTVQDRDFMTVAMIHRAFFYLDQLGSYSDYSFEAPHHMNLSYGAYLGVIPIIIFIYTFVKLKTVQVKGLMFATLCCFVLMLGHFSPVSPWALIHSLPVFDMVRASNRLSSMIIFSISVLSILGLNTFLNDKGIGRNIKYASSSLLIIVVAINYFAVLFPVVNTYSGVKQTSHSEINYDKPFRHRNLNQFKMFTAVANNAGVNNCYRGLELPNNTFPVKFGVISSSESVKASLEYSVNSIKINVDAKKDGSLLINENYHRNWIVSSGQTSGTVNPVDGLLSIDIPDGKQTIILSYKPYAFKNGIIISSVWLLLIILGVYVLRKKRLINT